MEDDCGLSFKSQNSLETIQQTWSLEHVNLIVPSWQLAQELCGRSRLRILYFLGPIDTCVPLR